MIHSRLADWVLACATAPDNRDAVAGDLAEEYAIRLSEGSQLRAVCWYWSQVFRTVPWLLWIPVRKGLFGVLVVALAACVVQAGVELFAASVIRTLLAPDAAASLLIGLAVVLLSMFAVSYVAARVRPGAGTLLMMIAIVAVLAQSIAMGPAAFGLSHVAAALAAPLAALSGAVLSTARAG
jgi:hypothetical protein